MENLLSNPVAIAALLCGVAAIFIVVRRTINKRDDG